MQEFVIDQSLENEEQVAAQLDAFLANNTQEDIKLLFVQTAPAIQLEDALYSIILDEYKTFFKTLDTRIKTVQINIHSNFEYEILKIHLSQLPHVTHLAVHCETLPDEQEGFSENSFLELGLTLCALPHPAQLNQLELFLEFMKTYTGDSNQIPAFLTEEDYLDSTDFIQFLKACSQLKKFTLRGYYLSPYLLDQIVDVIGSYSTKTLQTLELECYDVHLSHLSKIFDGNICTITLNLKGEHGHSASEELPIRGQESYIRTYGSAEHELSVFFQKIQKANLRQLILDLDELSFHGNLQDDVPTLGALFRPVSNNRTLEHLSCRGLNLGNQWVPFISNFKNSLLTALDLDSDHDTYKELIERVTTDNKTLKRNLLDLCQPPHKRSFIHTRSLTRDIHAYPAKYDNILFFLIMRQMQDHPSGVSSAGSLLFLSLIEKALPQYVGIAHQLCEFLDLKSLYQLQHASNGGIATRFLLFNQKPERHTTDEPCAKRPRLSSL